jgi:uncharacterized membrane protein YhaH (DUF805 family)
MNLGNLLFSFQGRIGRGPFWLGFVIIFVVETALDLLLGVSIGSDPTTMRGRVIEFVIGAVLLYPIAAVAVKRPHDRGQPGSWVWLLLGALATSLVGDLFGIFTYFSQPPVLVWIVGIAAGIVSLGFLIELGFRGSRPRQFDNAR